MQHTANVSEQHAQQILQSKIILKRMAKLFINGVVVMYDVVENVKQAESMMPAGINVKVVEDLG